DRESTIRKKKKTVILEESVEETKKKEEEKKRKKLEEKKREKRRKRRKRERRRRRAKREEKKRKRTVILEESVEETKKKEEEKKRKKLEEKKKRKEEKRKKREEEMKRAAREREKERKRKEEEKKKEREKKKKSVRKEKKHETPLEKLEREKLALEIEAQKVKELERRNKEDKELRRKEEEERRKEEEEKERLKEEERLRMFEEEERKEIERQQILEEKKDEIMSQITFMDKPVHFSFLPPSLDPIPLPTSYVDEFYENISKISPHKRPILLLLPSLPLYMANKRPCTVVSNTGHWDLSNGSRVCVMEIPVSDAVLDGCEKMLEFCERLKDWDSMSVKRKEDCLDYCSEISLDGIWDEQQEDDFKTLIEAFNDSSCVKIGTPAADLDRRREEIAGMVKNSLTSFLDKVRHKKALKVCGTCMWVSDRRVHEFCVATERDGLRIEGATQGWCISSKDCLEYVFARELFKVYKVLYNQPKFMHLHSRPPIIDVESIERPLHLESIMVCESIIRRFQGVNRGYYLQFEDVIKRIIQFFFQNQWRKEREREIQWRDAETRLWEETEVYWKEAHKSRGSEDEWRKFFVKNYSPSRPFNWTLPSKYMLMYVEYCCSMQKSESAFESFEDLYLVPLPSAISLFLERARKIFVSVCGTQIQIEEEKMRADIYAELEGCETLERKEERAFCQESWWIMSELKENIRAKGRKLKEKEEKRKKEEERKRKLKENKEKEEERKRKKREKEEEVKKQKKREEEKKKEKEEEEKKQKKREEEKRKREEEKKKEKEEEEKKQKKREEEKRKREEEKKKEKEEVKKQKKREEEKKKEKEEEEKKQNEKREKAEKERLSEISLKKLEEKSVFLRSKLEQLQREYREREEKFCKFQADFTNAIVREFHAISLKTQMWKQEKEGNEGGEKVKMGENPTVPKKKEKNVPQKKKIRKRRGKKNKK
ncbi:hypothetical protein ADUPG1_011952, partial [Aduncisulcus paluster]